MNQYLPQIRVGLGFLLCFLHVLGSQAVDNVWFLAGAEGKFTMPLVGVKKGIDCEFPGRSQMKNRVTTRSKPYTTNTAEIKIANVEYGDAGTIRCETSEGSNEYNLIVYDKSSVQELNAQPISETEILVSFKAPLKNPELVQEYTITVFKWPANKVLTQGPRVNQPSESGEEAKVVPNVPQGTYRVQVVTYYPYRTQSISSVKTSFYLYPTAWENPTLSIQASALSSDTALVSINILDSENITNLELTYFNGSTGQNWTQIPLKENERFAFVRDLQPQTTYYFKAKGKLINGAKEAVTHVKTPRSAIPSPTAVIAQPVLNGSTQVSWTQENSDGVKGYKLTIEKQQQDKSYIIETETITSQQMLYVNTISEDSQYRFTVSAVDLNGLGRPSEPFLYPEIPEATTANPVKCPTAITVEDEGDDESHDYELHLRVVKQTSSRLRVTWFLLKGEFSSVKRYQVILTSDTGRQLLDSKVGGNQRSIILYPLSNNADYTVTVKALDSQGKLLTEKQVNVSEGESSEAELLLVVGEIRHKHARLVWTLRNVEPSKLKEIRLLVQKDGPGGRQVDKRTISADERAIRFSNMPANSVYYITVDAIGQDGKAFLSSVLTLKTPEPGNIGEPITGAPNPKS